MATIALCIVFSASAQFKGIAKTVDPNDKLIYRNGNVFQNGVLMPWQVKEVFAGNSEAIKQYNGGKVLSTIGTIVMIPGGAAVGTGLALLLIPNLGGDVNDDNKAGINTGSAILIGGGVLIAGTGFLLTHLGNTKIKKSVMLHNSSLNKDMTYELSFGITPSGGVGLTLLF
ncbi:MAG: hypothetical protein LBE56_13525 [Tannerella sp.]|nr:hypothetical protein [Tannerella sp.]